MEITHGKNKRPRITNNNHDHNESKECLDDVPPGLTSACHDGDVDSETDNISEVTPPKASKYELLTPLLKMLFHGQRSVPNLNIEENEIIEKPQISNYNALTLKIHPTKPMPTPVENIVPFDQARYLYLLQNLYTVADLVNKRDLKGIESIVQDICLESCTFKTPALKEPVIGRDHILEFFRSVMRVGDDLHGEVFKCSEEPLNGCMVISSHYKITGVFTISGPFKFLQYYR